MGFRVNRKKKFNELGFIFMKYKKKEYEQVF